MHSTSPTPHSTVFSSVPWTTRTSLWVLGLWLLSSLGQSQEVHASTLWLSVVDEQGTPIESMRAELLPFKWRRSTLDPVPLEENAGVLQIPLDPDWLEAKTGIGDLTAQVQIDVDGYALWRSDAYTSVFDDGGAWLGWQVTFPEGASVTVPRGENLYHTVTLKRSGRRSLQFVDTDGEPVVDVAVAVHVLGNRSNACSALAQSPLLVRGVTDSAGELWIPEVDAAIAVVLERGSVQPGDTVWSMAEPDAPGLPERSVVSAKELDAPIRLERWDWETWRIEVTQKGQPAAGFSVGAIVHCTCGACGGTLGTTDADGVFEHTDAFRDRYTRLNLWDADRQELLWEAPLDTLPDGGVLKIDLP